MRMCTNETEGVSTISTDRNEHTNHATVEGICVKTVGGVDFSPRADEKNGVCAIAVCWSVSVAICRDRELRWKNGGMK